MNNIDLEYQKCLDYIFTKLPMFTRVGAVAYKPNLNNITHLCEAIGNPQNNFKTIHIGGTNGKGSCSHMLSAVFQSNGYKTGLYTSPHVIDFRERIKINGIEIPKKQVIDFIANTTTLIETLNPSFFEITVAMAFHYFSSENVDIAIIEVGLGGLLDSTNIILPELSIITNISLDHTNLLGNTIQEIAVQKAGIIKENIPVIIGETQQEITSIFFTKTIQAKSSIFYADQQFQIVDSNFREGQIHLKIVNQLTMQIEHFILDLVGEYQLKNIKTVLTAIEVLKKIGWKLDNENNKFALSHVKNSTGFKGRFEIVQQNPFIVFDVSHNEAGITELIKQLNHFKVNNLHIILGFVSDKDVRKVMSLFPKNATYYFSQAQIPRAMPFHELQTIALEFELKGTSFATISSAFEKAKEQAHKNDLILITGSFFNLEEAYSILTKES